jgi:Ca2+-binding RTX toxin-like protein
VETIMASFNFNTFTTTAQVLASTESGFVGTQGGISTDGTTAVTIGGASSLTVLGAVSALGADAILAGSSASTVRLTVGADGTVSSGFDDAIDLNLTVSATILNAGTIVGQGSAIAFVATDASAGLNLSNAGTLIGNSGNTVSAFVAAGTARIDNSGVISNGSSFSAVSVSMSTGGLAVINNTGTIKTSPTGTAIDTNGRAVVFNSGTITGSVILSGSDASKVTNVGLIQGDLSLGSGEDEIDLRGGRVTGTVSGGGASDLYFIDDSATVINDSTGLFDRILSWTSYTASFGIELLQLRGGDNISGHLSSTGSLLGNTGDNRLSGSGESDTIAGGFGMDTLVGRKGDDSYAASASDVIIEWADGGTDLVNLEVEDGRDELYVMARHIENLEVLDTFDRIVGNAANNVINAQDTGGAMTIDGAGGADTLTGGSGNTTFVTDGGDTLADFGGIDTVQSSASLTLAVALENLVLTGTAAISGTGNAGVNDITGNAGANLLDGAGGTDTLRGGAGNDTFVTDGGDTLIERSNQGSDTVRASVSFTLGTNFENLTLTGGAAQGTGNGVANRIVGTTGANALAGQGGSDTLTGGGGDDVFVFNAALGTGNIDRITDFDTATDAVLLGAGVFTGLPAGPLAAGAFLRNATGLAADAGDRIIFETDTGRLYFDRDGTGAIAGVHFATLNANIALAAVDFLVA